MKDNKVDNNMQYDNPDDILAMLQGFQEDEIDSSNDIFAMDDSDTLIGNENIDINNIEYGTKEQDSMDQDLLALLDMITKQEEPEKEIIAIDDLSNDYSNDDLLAYSQLWEQDTDLSLDSDEMTSMDNKNNEQDNTDIGDIFSDVLGVLNHEKDEDFFTPSDFDKLTFDNVTPNKATTMPDSIINDSLNNTASDSDENVDAVKKGLFSKLFSKNVDSKDDKKPVKVKKGKVSKKTKVDKKVKAISETKNEDKLDKKKKSKTKQAKNQNSKSRSKTDEDKAIVKPIVKKKNKNTELRKAKLKALKETIGEGFTEPVDTKPLNKSILAATILLVATLGIVITLGSKLFSEKVNEDSAVWNFERGRYEEAYDKIKGEKITVKNKEIHEKITTVMYVNHFYNTHFSLYELEMYPEALDSLIQGLRNYDRNIDNATTLGIAKNIDEIRDDILKELEDKFNIKAKTAIELSKTEDKLEYSKNVHTIVGKLK